MFIKISLTFIVLLVFAPFVSFSQDSTSIKNIFSQFQKPEKNMYSFVPDYLIFLLWNSKGKSVYHRRYTLAEQVEKRINNRFKQGIEGIYIDGMESDCNSDCLEKQRRSSDFIIDDTVEERIKQVTNLLGAPDGIYINRFAHRKTPPQNVITLVYGFECYDEYPVKDLGHCQSYLYINISSCSCVIDAMIVMQ